MLKSLDQFNYLYHLLEQLQIKIVRATSPLDHQTIWMEFFHAEVSKGNAAHFLCQKLGVNPINTLGIGNDFNDIDLLNFTHHSYVVDNAPLELKQKYQTTASVNQNGFSQVVRKFLTM
jgi:hydroxymethylpyrimidine pyrophosphatase-like HAD family hydrolase